MSRNGDSVFAFCLDGNGHDTDENADCLNGCGTDMPTYIELNGGSR